MMKKRTWIPIFFCMMLAVLSTSCSLLPSPRYNGPKLYDIGVPETYPDLPYTLTVLPFTTDTSARYKMLYRVGENQLETDEYNRWTLPPGSMLTKYLSVSFKPTGPDLPKAKRPAFILSGKILFFEADLTKNAVRLTVEYRIERENTSADEKPFTSSFSILEPLPNNSPDEIANAMGRAVKQFADRLKSQMDTLITAKK